MSNNKQSSVEWLYDELFNSFQKFIALKLTTEEYIVNNLKLLEQAKAIHKEEHYNTFHESRLTHPMIGFKHETFKEYYNETFGKTKSEE